MQNENNSDIPLSLDKIKEDAKKAEIGRLLAEWQKKRLEEIKKQKLAHHKGRK